MWFIGGDDEATGPHPFAPPDNEVPVVVPLDLIVHRTSDAALVLTHAEVFSRGWRLHLAGRLRPTAGVSFYGPGHGIVGREEGLLGVEYADGRRGASLHGPGRRGDGLVVVQSGGGGGPHEQDTNWWVNPLPPAGSVVLTVVHRAVRDGELRVEVDASPILEAATGVIELWPWEPEPRVEEPVMADLNLPPDGWFRRFLDDTADA